MNQYRTTITRRVADKTFFDPAKEEVIEFITDEKPVVEEHYGDTYFKTADCERRYRRVVQYVIEPLPIFHEYAPINRLPRHAVFQIIRDAVRSEMERMAKEEQS